MIAHSRAETGVELKTVLLRYPRFIHAEELTHRVLSSTPDEIIIQTIADGLMYDRNLSRNASSSRAIPVKRLIDDILQDTAMPIHWGRNQAGMQAFAENNAPVMLFDKEGHGLEHTREEAWLAARDRAIEIAQAFDAAGYHKQIVNRLLEPFSHINVLVTATEWDNFFELRNHTDAQPEIGALAVAILEAFANSTPVDLKPGQWHLPFVDVERDSEAVAQYLVDVLDAPVPDQIVLDTIIKLSVARCARTSYLTHDMQPPTIAKDIELYDRLVGMRPLHASPAEHQATPDSYPDLGWANKHLHGNFNGFIQYRKILEASFVW